MDQSTIVVIAIAVIGFLIAGVMLGRQTSRRKKDAIESLKAEKATVSSVGILDLVEAEVDDLGLRAIEGAAGIPPDVLLRAWRDAPHELAGCDHADLRIELASGVEPADATVADVTIVCPHPHSPQPAEPNTEAPEQLDVADATDDQRGS